MTNERAHAHQKTGGPVQTTGQTPHATPRQFFAYRPKSILCGLLYGLGADA